MSKSITLKDNTFIDARGVNYNRQTLQAKLDDLTIGLGNTIADLDKCRNIYNEPVKVGKWFDGSDLYRVVIGFYSPVEAHKQTKVTTIDWINPRRVLNFYGVLTQNNDGNTWAVNSSWDADYHYNHLFFNGNNFYMKVGENLRNYEVLLVVEYIL